MSAQASGEKQRYLSDFRRFAESRSRRDPTWIRPVREAAITRFAEVGFPSPREENWKYTNLSRVVTVPFRHVFELGAALGNAAPIAATELGDPVWPRLVFVNGRFAPGLSSITHLPAGVQVQSLAAALASDGEVIEQNLARRARSDGNGFTALSTAFLEDGAFVRFSDGAVCDRPIELVFVASATSCEVLAQPRVLVVCGRASRGTLIESYLSHGDGKAFSNAVSEVTLGADAELAHIRVVREAPRAAHVATTEVAQGRDSRYHAWALVFESAFLRHDLNVVLEAQGAQCALDGLYLASGEDFVDNHTSIDHAAPHGTSREVYKGILSGRAKAVFNGKVVVRPDAQKTDARQTNKNLLLSGNAEIDTKPELQILADDVKCAHGAAIGQLDPEALFYLKSRGIGEAAARGLLTQGFGAEVIRRVPSEPLRTRLEQAFLERLGRDAKMEER
jgi:Fe-S cluster assembly protein SufD